MYPKTFFQHQEHNPESGTCFVMMPFAASFTKVYNTIRESLENSETNFICTRADDIRGGGNIMETVFQQIGDSEIVIADLTGKNPNVFYELGIAHMLKDPKKVILLIQDIESMPFDLTPFRCIVYKTGSPGAKQLKTELQNAIRDVVNYIKLPGVDKDHPTYQFTVKEKEDYHFSERLHGEENCIYDFVIRPEYIGADAVKFMLSVTQYAAGFQPVKLPSAGYGITKTQAKKIPKIPWNLRIQKITGRTATFQLIFEPIQLIRKQKRAKK